MDEIQAAILDVKLNRLDIWNEFRNKVAKKYLEGIKNDQVKLPSVSEYNNHVWHLFVVEVENREDFMEYLKNNGITSLIHYPTAIHKQNAYEEYSNLNLPIAIEKASKVVSLPMYYGLTDEEVDYVIDIINKY